MASDKLRDAFPNAHQAVLRHRPKLYTKHHTRTEDPDKATGGYCDECCTQTGVNGCPTWETARAGSTIPAVDLPEFNDNVWDL